MKTKPCIDDLIKAAEEVCRQTGSFPSLAEVQLRKALGIRIPLHVSHLVRAWASGPAETVDTIDGINSDAFLQGPASDITQLDDIPEGHVLVGLGKNGEAVARCAVLPLQEFKWIDNYETERFLKLRQFYDLLDLDEIFPDGATSLDAGTDWRLLGDKGDQLDDWRKDLLVNTRTKGRPARKATIVVLFKPNSRRIISAKVDDMDLMPMVSQLEPESPPEHNVPGFRED